MECLWVNVIVPSTVTEQVHRIHVVLAKALHQMCVTYQDADEEETTSHPHFVLNASDYLFVSTIVAKAYPNLLESMIVLSYRNHLPGEIASHWGVNTTLQSIELEAQGARQRSLFKWFAIPLISFMSFLSSFVFIPLLAMIPIGIQRFVLRLCQPFILGGLAYVWIQLKHHTNPFYLTLFVIVVVLMIGYFLYHQFYQQTLHRDELEVDVKDFVPIVPIVRRPAFMQSEGQNDHQKTVQVVPHASSAASSSSAAAAAAAAASMQSSSGSEHSSYSSSSTSCSPSLLDEVYRHIGPPQTVMPPSISSHRSTSVAKSIGTRSHVNSDFDSFEFSSLSSQETDSQQHVVEAPAKQHVDGDAITLLEYVDDSAEEDESKEGDVESRPHLSSFDTRCSGYSCDEQELRELMQKYNPEVQ
jgi:hypothetical protein